ncbi:MAG: T9SS type A sorting domain-containing protein [Chitinophagales bacterium]
MKTSQSYLKLTGILLFLLFIYRSNAMAQQSTAINDTIYVASLADITINVLVNDIVEINETTTINIVSEPSHGTAERNFNNNITYTPFSNFIDDQLSDSFSYTINDDSNEAQVFLILKDCPSCVWPGDTDRDGNVNVWDLIPIGLAYGSTGTPRNMQGTSWNGYPTAENWGETLYESDYKYIDCNGDGTIDELDVAAIDQNYEASHEFAALPTLPAASSAEFSIALEIENTEAISWGDTVIFNIMLGLAGQTPEDILYGAAFSFTPPQGFIKSAEIDFSESVVGTNDNTISLSKTIADSTRFDAAIVRTDFMPVSNSGLLGKINVVMVEVLEGKTGDFEEMITVSLDNFTAVNANGESLAIDNVFGDSFLFVGTENVFESNVPKLTVFPNPMQDIFTITLPPSHDFESLEIIDISGKTVLQQHNLQFFTDKIIVDTKGLNNGFYLLKMQMAETQITEKISVLRP